jgi:uncharacterized protein (DUF305 family)
VSGRRWGRVVVLLAAPTLAIASACSGEPGPNAADRAFVRDAALHHELGEVLITIAETRSSDVRLRRLVFEQGAYHGPELHRLQRWADEWGVTTAETDSFPGELPDATIAALRIADGPAFDALWLDAMIEHHRGFLQIAEAAERGALVAAFAAPIATVQRTQIDQMQSLRAELA